MSQVNGSIRCKRETMDHSCAADTLRWKWSWSQTSHVRKDNIPEGIKSRISRVESDECERVTQQQTHCE